MKLVVISYIISFSMFSHASMKSNELLKCIASLTSQGYPTHEAYDNCSSSRYPGPYSSCVSKLIHLGYDLNSSARGCTDTHNPTDFSYCVEEQIDLGNSRSSSMLYCLEN